jgi:hypothetical protein
MAGGLERVVEALLAGWWLTRAGNEGLLLGHNKSDLQNLQFWYLNSHFG